MTYTDLAALERETRNYEKLLRTLGVLKQIVSTVVYCPVCHRPAYIKHDKDERIRIFQDSSDHLTNVLSVPNIEGCNIGVKLKCPAGHTVEYGNNQAIDVPEPFHVKRIERAEPDAAWYVSKSGSNSNPGTLASPFLTIGYALTKAAAGDTIFVETGTYNERLIPPTTGKSGYPITIQNYNGESVTVDGTGISAGGSGLVYINNVSYITLSGLTIQNAGSSTVDEAGVFIYGTCNYITLENLTITKTGMSGIWAGSNWSLVSPMTCTNLLISGCTLLNTNEYADQEGISLNCVSGFTVENTTVTWNPVNANGRVGIDMKVGTSTGSIVGCIVTGAGLGGIYVGGVGNQSNISIYDNTVTASGSGGLQLGDEEGKYNLSGIYFYNNQVYGNQRGFEIDHHGTEVLNFYFVNNTLYGNGTLTEIFQNENASNLSGCVIRNNIIDAANGAVGMGYSTLTNITVDSNLWYNCTGVGTNIITGNPEFVNTAAHNFALEANSPAIGKASTAGFYPTTDFLGNPWTGCIGAYQYQSMIRIVSGQNNFAFKMTKI
jgi:hypothetical protein